MVEENAVMRTGFLTGSRYSPGNMDRESLETLFVGRGDLMDDVLIRAKSSIGAPQKHYLLLVGPRGSGKTHFLALAHHRLKDHIAAAGATDRVAVALLKEEEWGVASYLDFVVRILRALANESPELGARIDDVYAAFDKDPARAEALGTDLLREHTRGRTLLLLCENLVDLFQGLGDEGQRRWRASIQEDGNWAIVATTPQLFSALTLQENPFFGFFTVRMLDQLDLDGGVELLAKKAVHEGKSGLAEYLRTPTGRARVRAIHHLAAGNHRAYVVLFDFLDKESLDDLVTPFMHMVDDLTPYYQDRMRQLAPTQRKIVEFLCVTGQPVTVKDIATPCLMSQQTAAKQISELDNAGFVARTRVGRNTFCELAEPLMRICIEVKDNNTGHFRLFVEFLRHWFTTRELQQRRNAFQDEDTEIDQRHVEEAIRCSLSDSHAPFVDALEEEAARCHNMCDYRGLATIQETLARDGNHADDFGAWVYALVMLDDCEAAISVAHEALAIHPEDGSLLFHSAHAYLGADRADDALDIIDRAIDLDSDDPANHCCRANILLYLKRFEEAIVEAETVLDAEPDQWHSLVQIIAALVGLERPHDAEARVSELVQLAPDDPAALIVAARLHAWQDRLDQALQLVDRAIDIDVADEHESARQLRGSILLDMSEYERASRDLRHFAEKHPDSVRTHCRLVDALLYSEQFEEAVQVAEHLLCIDPDHHHAHYVRGHALMGLGMPAAAIAAFDELLPTTDWRSLLSVAADAQQLEDFSAAARYLDRVEELAPDDLGLWSQRTRLAIESGAFETAQKCATKVEAMPNGSLLGRLLAAQAVAATKPLIVAWETLGPVDPAEYRSRRAPHQSAFVDVLAVSVRKFGPRYLAEGLARSRGTLGCLVEEGVLGDILTDFLVKTVDSLAGALEDWETAIHSIAVCLDDIPDCRIPLEMLRTAVQYTKTADERYLLRLPLEQRELLREVL